VIGKTDMKLTAGDFRVRILLQVGVEHGVADLVAHLICNEGEERKKMRRLVVLQVTRTLPT